jgi:hypothetical protein
VGQMPLHALIERRVSRHRMADMPAVIESGHGGLRAAVCHFTAIICSSTRAPAFNAAT